MAENFSFFEFPKDFPHDLYTEILDTKGKLLTELHDIFPENNRYSKPYAFQNWEDTARLKIKFLISRFENNKFLKPELPAQIKDISQLLIQKIENYHRSVFPKIDIFPF